MEDVFMSKEDMGRKDAMISTFIDTSMDSITKWGNEFISANIPKTMDCITAQIKQVFSSVANNSNVKSRDFIRNVVFQGIEIGEENKERALVLAMKEMGIDEGQINDILETSKRFLVTINDVSAE